MHEHLAMASSWSEPAFRKVARMPGVRVTTVDQCQFGMESGGQPIKKPTKWMTNMPRVSEELMKRCSGKLGQCDQGGAHITCTGKRA